jgi:hypothetical protein
VKKRETYASISKAAKHRKCGADDKSVVREVTFREKGLRNRFALQSDLS